MALSGVVSEIWRNIGTASQFSPTPPLFDALWRRQHFTTSFGVEN